VKTTTSVAQYAETSLLALPMNAKGVKIGAIIIGFGGGYTISEVDTAVGEYAANQIAPLFSKWLHSMKSGHSVSSWVIPMN